MRFWKKITAHAHNRARNWNLQFAKKSMLSTFGFYRMGYIGIGSIGGKNMSKTPKTKEPSHQKAMTTIRRQKERNTHFTI